MPGFFNRPPKPIGTPIPQEEQDAIATRAQSLDPSWKKAARSGFEGAMDFSMGALGVSHDSQMNRLGQMAPMMSGIMRGPSSFMGAQAPNKMSAFTVKNISHLNQVPDIESYKQFLSQGMSHPEAVAAAAGAGKYGGQSAMALENLYGPKAMNYSRTGNILDEAGRPVAPWKGNEAGVDPAYAAHMGSSRNKYGMKR